LPHRQATFWLSIPHQLENYAAPPWKWSTDTITISNAVLWLHGAQSEDQDDQGNKMENK
jgi:hypothetical protein